MPRLDETTFCVAQNLPERDVDIVHRLSIRLGPIGAGSARIAYVFGNSQCCQGPECSSSPTSGTTYSLVRGDFALTCVQSLRSRRLTGWVAGCGLTAAVACSGVWVAGSSPWLVGPPPAVVGLCGSSFRFCRVGRVWPTLVHGSPIRKQHDRDRTSPRRMPIGSCHGATRAFCPAKEGVDSVHTYVCFIGAVVTASRVQASHRCMGLLAPVSERNKPCGVSDIWRGSVIAMSPSRLIDCLVWLGI